MVDVVKQIQDVTEEEMLNLYNKVTQSKPIQAEPSQVTSGVETKPSSSLVKIRRLGGTIEEKYITEIQAEMKNNAYIIEHKTSDFDFVECSVRAENNRRKVLQYHRKQGMYVVKELDNNFYAKNEIGLQGDAQPNTVLIRAKNPEAVGYHFKRVYADSEVGQRHIQKAINNIMNSTDDVE